MPYDPFMLYVKSVCLFIAEKYSMVWCTNLLSIHPLKDIWLVSSLVLLQIKLLEYSFTGFGVNLNFHFSCVNTHEWDCTVSICLVLYNIVTLFSTVAMPFTSPPAMYERSSFSTSSPALGNIGIFYFSRADRCVGGLPLMSPVKMTGKSGAFRAWVQWLQISLTVPAFLIVVYTAAGAVWHYDHGKWGS